LKGTTAVTDCLNIPVRRSVVQDESSSNEPLDGENDTTSPEPDLANLHEDLYGIVNHMPGAELESANNVQSMADECVAMWESSLSLDSHNREVHRVPLDHQSRLCRHRDSSGRRRNWKQSQPGRKIRVPVQEQGL
jgi:hypothetical protein